MKKKMETKYTKSVEDLIYEAVDDRAIEGLCDAVAEVINYTLTNHKDWGRFRDTVTACISKKVTRGLRSSLRLKEVRITEDNFDKVLDAATNTYCGIDEVCDAVEHSILDVMCETVHEAVLNVVSDFEDDLKELYIQRHVEE